jgi:hypothetical protein
LISIENEISYNQAKRIGAVQGHLNLELFRVVQVFNVFLILLLSTHQSWWDFQMMLNDGGVFVVLLIFPPLSSLFSWPFPFIIAQQIFQFDFRRPVTRLGYVCTSVDSLELKCLQLLIVCDYSEMVKWLWKIVLNADCI